MSESKKRHILATADPGFIETQWEIPYRTCTGCSHHYRIRMEAPEWLLSVNCPCLECLGKYLMNYSDRLEHWTRNRIGTFAEDEWFDPDRPEQDGQRVGPRRPVEIVEDYQRGIWGIMRFGELILN